MKKLFIILLTLFFSFSAQANERFDGFNKWLFENGHTEYVSKSESAVCKAELII